MGEQSPPDRRADPETGADDCKATPKGEMSKSTASSGRTSGPSASRTIFLTCVDGRIEPLRDFAALGLDRPYVMRNPGGRVTPAALRDIAKMHYLIIEYGGGKMEEVALVIVHHTDCRAAKLAGRAAQRALHDDYGVDEEAAAALGVSDPTHSVREDIALLKASLKVPGPVLVSGHVFDTESRQLSEVAAPERFGG